MQISVLSLRRNFFFALGKDFSRARAPAPLKVNGR